VLAPSSLSSEGNRGAQARDNKIGAACYPYPGGIWIALSLFFFFWELAIAPYYKLM